MQISNISSASEAILDFLCILHDEQHVANIWLHVEETISNSPSYVLKQLTNNSNVFILTEQKLQDVFEKGLRRINFKFNFELSLQSLNLNSDKVQG